MTTSWNCALSVCHASKLPCLQIRSFYQPAPTFQMLQPCSDSMACACMDHCMVQMAGMQPAGQGACLHKPAGNLKSMLRSHICVKDFMPWQIMQPAALQLESLWEAVRQKGCKRLQHLLAWRMCLQAHIITMVPLREAVQWHMLLLTCATHQTNCVQLQLNKSLAFTCCPHVVAQHRTARPLAGS